MTPSIATFEDNTLIKPTLAGQAEVVKNLSKFFEGTPKVQTYEVANSTFHKIATVAA